METTQIYNFVNGAAKQVMGKLPITAQDTNSFVALGSMILSNDLVENFANTMVLRISRSIISYRRYNSDILKLMLLSEIEWGAIVQKLKVEMPEAVEDPSYELENGKSVDMYIVNKPKIHQKFFINQTPYSFFVTMQRWLLKRAFLSESVMGSLISAIYGEVQNKLEVNMDALGKATMANYMVNARPSQIINLVSDYNTATLNTLTTNDALFDSSFLRYAIGRMNLYAYKMRDMSNLWNDGTEYRHTPANLQRFAILADFKTQMETVVQWQAFNREFVEKTPNAVLSCWQNINSPFEIMATNKDEQEVTMNNVVAFIFDRDALGMYRKEEEVLTTPVNARARYYNTFWHEERMWFNDLSENGIIFTLN